MITMEFYISQFLYLITIVNLIILGLNLKLYTEYFKDRKIERRQSEKNEKGSI